MVSKLFVIAIAIILAISIVIGIYEVSIHRIARYSRPLIPEAIEELIEGVPQSISIKSSFSNFSRIPMKYTCDGSDISLPLTISGIPFKASCIAILMYDPDAPKGVFYHWLVYNVSATGKVVHIPQALPKTPVLQGVVQGVNSFGYVGYGGPCPPKGSTHRYVILVLALRYCPHVSQPLTIGKLLQACKKGKVLAYGILVGLYGR